jgi:DNA-binding response OmpR family regulator
MMPLVFVVDGVPERRSLVQHALEQAGYRVGVFATTRAVEIAEQQLPSLMIIALELPDGSGLMLRDKIRLHPALSSIAVVLLADNKIGKYRALGNSNPDATTEATDCLSFPFAPGELVNVVESALQRAGKPTSHSASEAAVDMVIDPAAMKIFVRGKEIATTTLEFRLLDYMARHQGKVFSRDALLDAVWGELQFVTPRSVDACIRRLRKKIEPESSSPRFLRTIRGIGYKLDVRPAWETTEEVCECAICSAARVRAKAASTGEVGRGSGSIDRAVSFR